MPDLKAVMSKLATVDGFVGSCVADANSGMMLASEGGGAAFNLEVAAASNTEVVRAEQKVLSVLELKDSIEDMLIVLGRQYHLIRPVAHTEGLFLYLVLDKAKSNLAMARHQLALAESSLEL